MAVHNQNSSVQQINLETDFIEIVNRASQFTKFKRKESRRNTTFINDFNLLPLTLRIIDHSDCFPGPGNVSYFFLLAWINKLYCILEAVTHLALCALSG